MFCFLPFVLSVSLALLVVVYCFCIFKQLVWGNVLSLVAGLRDGVCREEMCSSIKSCFVASQHHCMPCRLHVFFIFNVLFFSHYEGTPSNPVSYLNQISWKFSLSQTTYIYFTFLLENYIQFGLFWSLGEIAVFW